MRYIVVLHTDDGENYGVKVPDLPGCFSAGKGIDQALYHIELAIEEHLEILMADGYMPRGPARNIVDPDDLVDGILKFVDIHIPYHAYKRNEKAVLDSAKREFYKRKIVELKQQIIEFEKLLA